MSDPLRPLVQRAKAGDKNALEDLVRHIQDRIFGLSLHMLYHPQDAEDAAQEILIKIITHLGSFRGEGSFHGWAYKIAANHLNTFRRKRGRAALSFEKMASCIVAQWPEPWRELESEPMQDLIVEEFRIACLQMVLLGLDRAHRIAYILGEIFGVTGKEGGNVLNIAPAAFRKRLQRARSRVQNFLANHCALIRPGNPCLCERQTDHALATGLIGKKDLVFVGHPCHVRHDPSVMARLGELDELKRINALFKTHPGFCTPSTFVEDLRKLIHSDKFQILTVPADH